MKSICSIIHIQRFKLDESPFRALIDALSTQASPYRFTSPSHPSQPFYSSHLISSHLPPPSILKNRGLLQTKPYTPKCNNHTSRQTLATYLSPISNSPLLCSNPIRSPSPSSSSIPLLYIYIHTYIHARRERGVFSCTLRVFMFPCFFFWEGSWEVLLAAAPSFFYFLFFWLGGGVSWKDNSPSKLTLHHPAG
jgi:hypothetical protein